MKYYPHTEGEIEKMLKSIGVDSVDALFSDIPRNKLIRGLSLPYSISEIEVTDRMKEMSGKNRSFYDRSCFLGAGIYRHFSPAVVDAVLSRSEFYTSYTPYQAEASQGVLQSIFEYQTMIAAITGMDISNASLYDGSTASAEAVSLSLAQSGKKEVIVSEGIHPEYIEVIRTYFHHMDGVKIITIPLKDGITDMETLNDSLGADTASVLIQSPNCLGFIEDQTRINGLIKSKSKKALHTALVDEPLSLGILKSPGACGVDITVGEASGLGLPPSFGGPSLGFMAVKSKYLRKIPGRLVGQTVDGQGRRAFCLTLQAREQHIRREKAASNICTNQALCALAATVYLSYMGKYGFSSLAKLNFEKAHYLSKMLEEKTGFRLYSKQPFFNEFSVSCPVEPRKVNSFLHQRGIIGGFDAGRWSDKWKNLMIFSVTELNTRKQMDDLIHSLVELSTQEVATHV